MRKKTTLKDIACFSKGSQINGDLLLDEGKYEYLNGGTKASGTWNEFNVNGKTITISEGGNSCGYVNFMEEKFWCGAHCYYLFDVKCKPKYLYYLLKGNQSNLMKLRSGACMPNIKKSDLGNFKFIYDNDVIHQDKIISIFDNLTNVIYFYEKQIKYFDNLVKARFIEMFGDLKSNEKDWDLKTFEEMSVLITDGEHSTPKRTKEGIYLLSARNILNHYLQLEDVDYIDRDEYIRIAKRVVPKKGDILISCSGTIGRCCSVPDCLQFQMVRSVALIRFKEVINPIFAEYMITSDYLQEQINSSKTMSSQANLFQGKIRKLKGFLPPIELQNQFANFVQQVDKSRFDIKKSIIELEREVVYD